MISLQSNTVRSMEMVIHPDLARRMLDTSCGNRNLRNGHIKELVGAIKRGEWKLTHQGISFDKNGCLRDGHHRLTACIMTDTPIRVMVTLGLDVDAFFVIDIGAKRSLSDNTGIDKRISEPLRLAARLYYGSDGCTPERCLHIGDSGLLSVLTEIIETSGTSRRYYGSAPIKLAAALLIMDNHGKDYILSQYRALTLLDFDAMSAASKSLIRQVESGHAIASKSGDALARGLCVFDESRKHVSKIQVSEESIGNAMVYMRQVITSGMREIQ